MSFRTDNTPTCNQNINLKYRNQKNRYIFRYIDLTLLPEHENGLVHTFPRRDRVDIVHLSFQTYIVFYFIWHIKLIFI